MAKMVVLVFASLQNVLFILEINYQLVGAIIVFVTHFISILIVYYFVVHTCITDLKTGNI